MGNGMNKVPLGAAMSLSPEGHPLYTNMAAVVGFTRKAVAEWARVAIWLPVAR